MVDVEQGALRAFEEHALALLAQVMQDAGDIGLHGLHEFAECERIVIASAGSRPRRRRGNWVSTKL